MAFLGICVLPSRRCPEGAFKPELTWPFSPMRCRAKGALSVPTA